MRKYKDSVKIYNSESGNIFFALFGAIALVGIIGASTVAIMRGPLSTMVEVQSRTQAESEMAIASRLSLLEATQMNADGDCDADGFVEPLEFTDAGGNGPTGGGFLPSEVSSNRTDPWGSEYGYCAWDAGSITNYAGTGYPDTCDNGGGSSNGSYNRLAGSGSASDETYSIVAIISAGANMQFETTCTGGATPGATPDVTKGGDDIVVEYTYESAVTATNGLWNIKTGEPNVAEIDKEIEVGGNIDLNRGGTGTGQLLLGAGSMIYPDQTVLNTCPGAANVNVGLIRMNTSTTPYTLEMCNASGWASVGGSGLWTDGTGDDIYYNPASPEVGIGTTTPDNTLDVIGTFDVSGAVTFGSTLDVTGASTVAGLNATGAVDFDSTLNVDGASTLQATTLTTLNATGAVDFDSTLNVDGASTLQATTLTTLNATGAVDFDSTLNVDGASTLIGNIDARGTIADSTGSLTLGDNVDITGDLDAQGDIADSTGNLTLDDTVDVTADLNVTNNLDVNGNADIDGTMEADDYTWNGNDFTPATCASGNFNRWDGTSWVCEDDIAGTSGGSTGTTGGIWENSSNLVRIKDSAGNWNTDDFVFGSDRLADVSGQTWDDSRMFFDKSKSAFRAGSSADTHWDDANVGQYSVAMGYNTTALGSGSIAIGTGSTSALSDYSIALGLSATASGRYSTAIGYGPGASGENSAAIGYGVQTSGFSATAFGTNVRVGNSIASDGTSPGGGLGDHSMGFGLGIASGNYPQITGDSSLGIFMGDQSGYDLTTANRMALVGGDFLIDDAGATGSNGCIRYSGATSRLQFSHDCTTWSDMVNASSIVGGSDTQVQYNDGGALAGDAGLTYDDTNNILTVGNAVTITGQAGNAPSYMNLDDLGDVDAASPANGECLVYNNGSGEWEAAACTSSGTAVLSGITAATADNSINNAAWNQVWNWQLTGNEYGFLISENAASTGGSSGAQSLFAINTVASSTASPLLIQNAGTNLSFAVSDEASDATPFVIDASGNIGIGTAAPASRVHINGYNDTYIGYSNGGNEYGIISTATETATGDSYGIVASTTSNPSTDVAGLGVFLNNTNGYGSIFRSDTVTTGSLMNFLHSTSAYSGNMMDANLAVGSGTFTGNFIRLQNNSDQKFYVADDGEVGAYRYCDEDGNNCFTSADISGAASPVFEVTGAAGSELVRQVTASAPYTTSDFVFGSPQLADDGDATHDNRFFFDKSKGAFRAGVAEGTEWDDANVGTASVAMGYRSNANGAYSTAIGLGARANAYGSVALGQNVTAGHTSGSGTYSVVLGQTVQTTANAAMGIGLGAATGTYPVVSGVSSLGIFMGDQSGIDLTSANTMALLGGDLIVGSYQLDDTTTGSQDNRMFFDVSKGAFRAGYTTGDHFDAANVGNYSAAFGERNRVAGQAAFSAGTGNSASGQNATALGSNNTASAQYSTALGYTSTASGYQTLAWGWNATASGNTAVVIGGSSTAAGDSSIVLGGANSTTATTGNNSMVMGFNNVAGGLNSVLLGRGVSTTAAATHSAALGLGNPAGANPQVSGDYSFGVFMGDQSGYDLATSNRMALVGGDFLIDDAGATGSNGCIRYDGTNSKLQFSHDCSTYTDMGALSGAIALNDLSDAMKNWDGTNDNMTIGHEGTNFTAGQGTRNLAIGYNAADSLTTGDDNIAIGRGALTTATTQSDNTAIGNYALYSAASSYNTAVGKGAMRYYSGNGSYNTAVGASAGPAVSGGLSANNNVSLGYSALTQTTAGDDNVAIGGFALNSNQAKEESTAVGYSSMRYMDETTTETPSYNSALGYNSLRGATTDATLNTGTGNTAIGHTAIQNITSGNNNTALGYLAGDTISSGTNNIAIGYNADFADGTLSNQLNIGDTIYGNLSTDQIAIGTATQTTGIEFKVSGTGGIILPSGTTAQRPTAIQTGMFRYNTTATPADTLEYYDLESSTWRTLLASGAGAVSAIDDLSDGVANNANIFLGGLAGNSNSGDHNTGLGRETLYSNTTGTRNTAMGSNTMYGNLSGGYNTALGVAAMYSSSTGNNNSVLGYRIMFSGSDGNDNTISGYQAGYTLDGDYNVIMGSGAGYAATDADSNIFIGYQAGDATTTGDNNILIGSSIDASSATASNELNIGGTIYGDLSTDQIAIGTATQTTGAQFKVSGTSSIMIPSGTDAQRPATGAAGMVRYNSDATPNDKVEYYDAESAAWVQLAGGAGGSAGAIDDLSDAFTDYTTGFNMYLGSSAGTTATTPQYNIAMGQNALNSLDATCANWDECNYNIALGFDALTANTTGNNNVAIGYQTLSANTTTQGNIAIGRSALASSRIDYGLAIGMNALTSNTTGNKNIAIGHNAMTASTTGSNNLALGNGALSGGNNNYRTGIGHNALASGGEDSTAVGYYALTNTTGSFNTGVGTNVMKSNTTGYSNTAMGFQALVANINGAGNAAFGGSALGSNINGAGNAAFGGGALGSNIDGGGNVAFGGGALAGNTSGGDNVGIGSQAGDNITTGSRNIIIGKSIDAPSATGSDQLNIGDTIYSDMATDRIAIGTATQTASIQLKVAGTGGIMIPSGTDAQRPATGAAGMVRYNSDATPNDKVEYYDAESAAWIQLSDGSGSSLWTDNTTHITRGNFHVLNTGLAAGSTTAGLDGDGMYSFYDPDKGAMRGGEVAFGEAGWQDVNIGNDSFAWGRAPRASGLASVALGDRTRATGESSLAVGYDSYATNNQSIAMGDTVASNGWGSFAMGVETAATANHSVSFGLGDATGTYPIVSGASSFGIFMGDQSGVDLSQANTVSIMGASGGVGIGTVTPSVALDVTGDIEYTGTITDVSDMRLKENIEPLTKTGNLLERLDKIDTYSFTMKDDKTNRPEFGVMAQELEKIFPELVHTAKDDIGTKSVNYIGLIAPMIEATKELKAENTELKSRMDDLSEQVALLNKMSGQNVNKPSMSGYFFLLIGLVFGFGGTLIIRRKKS